MWNKFRSIEFYYWLLHPRNTRYDFISVEEAYITIPWPIWSWWINLMKRVISSVETTSLKFSKEYTMACSYMKISNHMTVRSQFQGLVLLMPNSVTLRNLQFTQHRVQMQSSWHLDLCHEMPLGAADVVTSVILTSLCQTARTAFLNWRKRITWQFGGHLL